MSRWTGDLAPLAAVLRDGWRRLLPGTACGLLAMAASVALLALSGWFISAAAFAGLTAVTAQTFNFFFPSIGVRIFAFARTGARYGERVFSHDATFRILESLRKWFYRHLEPLAPARLMRYRSGDILNRIIDDVDALDNLYLRVLSPLAGAGLLTLLLGAVLWVFEPRIAVAGAGMLVAAGLVLSLAAGRAGARIGADLAAIGARMRIRFLEAVQGMPELLVYGVRQRQLRRLARVDRQLIQRQERMSRISGLTAAGLTLCSGLATVLVLTVGLIRVGSGDMSGAVLALVVLAVLSAFEAVAPLPNAFQYLGRTREAGRRLVEIVDAEPEVRFPENGVGVAPDPQVCFDRVCFRYGCAGPDVLSDVDLCLDYGQRVAVLGPTGSGKSTLVHLLGRFWDPTAGRIRIGGQDLREIGETDLRRLLTIVPQQPHMFSGTIRDNLLMACPDATESDVRTALATVYLDGFVASLPDGLDTWVGEAGKRLSGGQARRLALARAVLHNGPIWILDEPTEGLDPETEQRVLARLDAITRSRTVLVITHRLVGMERMDRILLIEGGRIVEDGTHAALLQQGARYAALTARILS